jgi:FKBP-type peptidyl-prolyl cis-trans isomerase SlyD
MNSRPARSSRSAVPSWARDDEGQEVKFTVNDISEGVARVDANHSLAGQTLVFEIELQGIRAASGEEISRGEALE